MTHKFEPGDKVKWKLAISEKTTFTLLELDEGRWVITDGEQDYPEVRPSELTPAEPGPDWATLKVRELVAAEATVEYYRREYASDRYDDTAAFLAFAKYLRANPPQPELTVEALVFAAANCGVFISQQQVIQIHAALTERQS